jgi:hypothetical protein
MNDTMLDTVTRHAAGLVSRRGLRRVLGGAAVAGVIAAPTIGSAGKAGKKAEKRCKRQREECRTVFADLCEGEPTCEAAYAPCCEHFSRCDAGKGIACMFQVD